MNISTGEGRPVVEDESWVIGVFFLNFLVQPLIFPMLNSLGLTLNEIRPHGELGRWKRQSIFQFGGHNSKRILGFLVNRTPISAGRNLYNPLKSSVQVANLCSVSKTILGRADTVGFLDFPWIRKQSVARQIFKISSRLEAVISRFFAILCPGMGQPLGPKIFAII